MSILDLFTTEAELTPAEQAMDALSLEGFNAVKDETLSLTERLRAAVGIKLDPATNSFVNMTSAERFEALPETEKLLFTGLEKQIERQNKLLAGEIDPSEAITERGQRRFDILKEQQARLGSNITGNTIDTATGGRTTGGIQSLSALREEQDLAVDAERRQGIADLDTSIRNRTGLLGKLQTNRISQLTNLPARLNITGIQNNAGLLRDINFETNREDVHTLVGGVGGLLGRYLSKP